MITLVGLSGSLRRGSYNSALRAAQALLRTLGADLWAGGRLLVSRAGKFDRNGNIVDAGVRDALRKFLDGFVARTPSKHSS